MGTTTTTITTTTTTTITTTTTSTCTSSSTSTSTSTTGTSTTTTTNATTAPPCREEGSWIILERFSKFCCSNLHYSLEPTETTHAKYCDASLPDHGIHCGSFNI